MMQRRLSIADTLKLLMKPSAALTRESWRFFAFACERRRDDEQASGQSSLLCRGWTRLGASKLR
jgi:hypothetical protein